jgi:hypothetical protein
MRRKLDVRHKKNSLLHGALVLQHVGLDVKEQSLCLRFRKLPIVLNSIMGESARLKPPPTRNALHAELATHLDGHVGQRNALDLACVRHDLVAS